MPPSFRTLAVLAVALLGAAPPATGGADESLVPTNYADGEVVREPVVLLRGAAPADVTEVVATNESSKRETRTLRGVARKGRYLALAELLPGENRVRLQAGTAEGRITLVYRAPTSAHVVRCVYLTDSTGDTTYQSQRADEVQDYAGKLDTAMKLLQCFTAERMHDLGFGRSTFNLELDANGRVDVHVLRGERPAADEYALDDQAWWREVDGLVGRRLPHPSAKNVVVAAYTRFDPATRRVHGHTALGGGDLGLFGSAGMFAWPSRLDDVFATFADATSIDGARVHDDSAGRSTIWGLASTTLGAVLHESGHAFGLPHSTVPLDVMTRGFDRFNRVFSLVEPPPRSGGAPTEFTLDEAAAFAPVSAAALRASPWFHPDEAPAPGDAPAVVFGDDGGATIDAPSGVRYVGFLRRGDAVGFRAFWDATEAPPRTVRVTAAELSPPGGGIDAIRVVDGAGATTIETVALPGRFVRAWRFAAKTRRWPDPEHFVALDAKDLARISADAASRPPVVSKGAFVDLRARFGPAPDQVAYAARELVLTAPLEGQAQDRQRRRAARVDRRQGRRRAPHAAGRASRRRGRRRRTRRRPPRPARRGLPAQRRVGVLPATRGRERRAAPPDRRRRGGAGALTRLARAVGLGSATGRIPRLLRSTRTDSRSTP